MLRSVTITKKRDPRQAVSVSIVFVFLILGGLTWAVQDTMAVGELPEPYNPLAHVVEMVPLTQFPRKVLALAPTSEWNAFPPLKVDEDLEIGNLVVCYAEPPDLSDQLLGDFKSTLEPLPSVPLSDEKRTIRESWYMRRPQKVYDVRPIYPEVARTAGVQGIVIVEALIGTDGTVKETRVLRSVPLLDQAAIDAVRQWQYTVTMLGGVPMSMWMTVTVQFTLQQ